MFNRNTDDGLTFVWLDHGRDLWGIKYRWGSRTADILHNRHAIDCVQVRDWDWSLDPSGQVSRVPTAKDLGPVLVEYITANAESVSLA